MLRCPWADSVLIPPEYDSPALQYQSFTQRLANIRINVTHRVSTTSDTPEVRKEGVGMASGVLFPIYLSRSFYESLIPLVVHIIRVKLITNASMPYDLLLKVAATIAKALSCQHS